MFLGIVREDELQVVDDQQPELFLLFHGTSAGGNFRQRTVRRVVRKQRSMFQLLGSHVQPSAVVF
jgi:hypothetical protein